MNKPELNSALSDAKPIKQPTEFDLFLSAVASKQDHLSDIQADLYRLTERLDGIANRLDPESYSKNIPKCTDSSESIKAGSATTSPALPGGIAGQFVKSVQHWEGLLNAFNQRILPNIDEAIKHIEKHI